MSRTATASTASRIFTVDAYDAYSGWDTLVESVSREAAWDACQSQACVRVYEVHADGDITPVYSKGAEDHENHGAWLGRCPR